jgi:hypothetical protein
MAKKVSKKQLQQVFEVAKTIMGVTCPKCKGEEVGYCFPTKEYDCACGHTWK